MGRLPTGTLVLVKRDQNFFVQLTSSVTEAFLNEQTEWFSIRKQSLPLITITLYPHSNLNRVDEVSIVWEWKCYVFCAIM